jgi:hypothetical protein
VFYRGEDDNHIYELRWRRQDDPHWRHFDLTKITETEADETLAADSPSAYFWDDHGSQHVFYRGQNNHIYELYWRRREERPNWRHADLTEITGAPAARGSPAAHVWQDDERQCVFFRGEDNHIHELRWRRQDDPHWSYFDLTRITETEAEETLAADSPATYVWDDDESQHVFYRGQNDHIHELHWRRRGRPPNWRHADLTATIQESATESNGITPERVEGEVARRIVEQLRAIPFGLGDRFIGTKLWVWQVQELRDLLDPTSLQYDGPISQRWNQSTGQVRGLFRDDWEITGHLHVDAR